MLSQAWNSCTRKPLYKIKKSLHNQTWASILSYVMGKLGKKKLKREKILERKKQIVRCDYVSEHDKMSSMGINHEKEETEKERKSHSVIMSKDTKPWIRNLETCNFWGLFGNKWMDDLFSLHFFFPVWVGMGHPGYRAWPVSKFPTSVWWKLKYWANESRESRFSSPIIGSGSINIIQIQTCRYCLTLESDSSNGILLKSWVGYALTLYFLLFIPKIFWIFFSWNFFFMWQTKWEKKFFWLCERRNR